MHGHGRLDGSNGRPRLCLVGVQHEVAAPILRAVAVLKLLRQAFRACREKGAWSRPMQYDLALDDGLNLTENGIDALDRALEALGDLETLVQASERKAAP